MNEFGKKGHIVKLTDEDLKEEIKWGLNEYNRICGICIDSFKYCMLHKTIERVIDRLNDKPYPAYYEPSDEKDIETTRIVKREHPHYILLNYFHVIITDDMARQCASRNKGLMKTVLGELKLIEQRIKSTINLYEAQHETDDDFVKIN